MKQYKRKDEGMEYIRKFPFILASSMSVMIGLISYSSGVKQQETYFRMAITLVLFFTLGMYVRSTLQNIIDEIEKKKIDEQIKRKEASKNQAEEVQKENQASSKIEYKVDDSEDFVPLAMSKAIRNEMNKD